MNEVLATRGKIRLMQLKQTLGDALGQATIDFGAEQRRHDDAGNLLLEPEIRRR